ATGQADDLLTSILLATTSPVLLVPAMNDHMWAHAQTKHNVTHLTTLGYRIVNPDEGDLAAGEGTGPGRMPEPETIFAHVGRLLEPRGSLSGKRVLVTAGPTREAIDPVRFISNHSSGKMGVALASAAWRRGADVTLIAGHVDIPLPAEIPTLNVDTVQEMSRSVAQNLPAADVLIMAAAPADFRPASEAPEKIKKGGKRAVPKIVLEATDDILQSTIPKRKKKSVIVGFALETSDGVKNARAKLKAKDLDLVGLNDAKEKGAGFGVDTNRVTVITRNGKEEELDLMSKTDLAEILLDRVERELSGR